MTKQSDKQDSQEKLLKLINDPELIKRAVEEQPASFKLVNRSEK